MRLLCDEMLSGLARWLRSAGHDTALADPGAPDAAVVARAAAEQRRLLSRDRRLVAALDRPGTALLLTGNGVEEQAAEVTAALGIDWLAAPFTRCLVDNAVLRPADAGEIARIPPRSGVLPGPIRACPACGRVYWPGSHVRRMMARLQRWQEGRAAAGADTP